MNDRKYYIDNIRWLWILLLVPFHAAMAWCNWESNYIWFYPSKVLSSIVILISPWFMPMLFVIAGISTKYALRKRSYGQYALERVKKLLIPMLTGIVTVVAPMTYIADKYHNQYEGNLFAHYKVFFTKFVDLTGYQGDFTPGHLWFLLFLFLISILALLIIALQKKIFPTLEFSKFPVLMVPFLIIIPELLKPILDFGDKSIGEDFGFFLLGYYILSEETVQEKVSKYRYIFLPVMLITDVISTYLFVWKGEQTGILLSLTHTCAIWFGILGFMALAKCKFNQNNSFTRFMSSNCFLFYIIHFLWLILLQYEISKLNVETPIAYILPILGTYLLTFLSCLMIERTPGIRFLFGLKKKGR